MRVLRYLLLLLVSSSLAAQGNAATGLVIWQTNCMQCHAGKEAWDLAHFQVHDSITIRRATVHVTLSEAIDIIAHINSLTVTDTMTLARRPFQPGGGVILLTDQAFGIKLFGSDQWPASLTRSQLLAIDPLNVQISFGLPLWADETSNVDWLPGTGQGTVIVPPGVMLASKKQLDAYYNNPNITTAMIAAKSLMTSAHNVNILDAPCMYGKVNSRYEAQLCGDVGKFGSTLLYVESIRSGKINEDAKVSTKHWWETGHLFHKAQQFGRPLAQRDLQIITWMWLGWMWDRALNKGSGYIAGPASNLGFNRHSTFHILRTMVERPSGNVQICADIENLGHYVATQWVINAETFGYHELMRRALSGQLPTDKTFCAEMVRRSQNWVGNRTGAVIKAQLQSLADSTITLIMK